MSVVTNVLLNMSIIEDHENRLHDVNVYLLKEHKSGLVDMDDESLPHRWYGGNKMLEVNLSIGSFNYLDLVRLCEHLRTINFSCPEDVQLIVCEQEESTFKIVDPYTYPKEKS